MQACKAIGCAWQYRPWHQVAKHEITNKQAGFDADICKHGVWVLRYRTDAETGEPGYKSKVGVCHTPKSQSKYYTTCDSKGKAGIAMTVWQLGIKQKQQQEGGYLPKLLK